MKIIFVGAHGTGKSTLVNKINEVFNLPIVESVSRQCQKVVKAMGYDPYAEEFKDNYQLMTTEFAFWDFQRICDWGLDCLMTRCPIDVVSYMMANNDPRYAEYLDRLQELNEQGAFDDSVFFYLPIEFPLVDDQCRPMDSDYQKLVDKYMKLIAKNLGLNLLTISGSVEERVSICTSYLISMRLTNPIATY